MSGAAVGRESGPFQNAILSFFFAVCGAEDEQCVCKWIQVCLCTFFNDGNREILVPVCHF